MSPFQTAVTHESKIFSANFCRQWLMDPTFTQKWSNFYNESGVIHDDTHSVQVSLWGSAMHRSSCLQVHTVFEPFPRLQNVETLSLLHWRPSFLVLHTIVNDQHHIFQVSFFTGFWCAIRQQYQQVSLREEVWCMELWVPCFLQWSLPRYRPDSCGTFQTPLLPERYFGY